MASCANLSPTEEDPSHSVIASTKTPADPLPLKDDVMDLRSPDENRCLCFKKYLHLLQSKEARVKELEEELKESKKNNSQLCETVRTLTGLVSKQAEEKATGHESQLAKEFMEKMEERAKRQEEMMAEMKETMNRDLEMVQKQLNVLQKAVEDSEGKEKEIGRNVEELAIDMTKKILDEKQDEDSKKWSEIHENLKNTEDAMQMMKEEMFQVKVNSLLSGDLEVLKKRIQIKNSEVVFENGTSFKFEDFQKIVEQFHNSTPKKFEFRHAFSVVKDPLWILTREAYNIKCFDCEKMVSLKNIDEDGISVKCADCASWNLLGNPTNGSEWILASSPCDHFQQVKKGEKPNECLVCGRGAPEFQSDWDEQIGTPKKKKTKKKVISLSS